MRILKIFSPLFSFQRVVSPQKWDTFFHFQRTLLFNFDPCSMVVIFLGTNSEFCQKAKQVIENRPVFTEWEQNIILLGQKMLLLFSCFQDHFVTNLIWKRKRKQTEMKKQSWESYGSLSSVHLCCNNNAWWQFWQVYLKREQFLQFSEPSAVEAICLYHRIIKSSPCNWE